MDGQLTLRGITKPVQLEIEYLGVQKTPWGTEAAGFTAHGEIDREEWGLTWNQTLESGGLLVSKKIELDIEIEAKAS